MVMASAPAAADSARVPPITQVAVAVAPRPALAQPATADVERALAALGITVPRKLLSGAPACGNVMGKGGRSTGRCTP
jgi:hypothetical protein